MIRPILASRALTHRRPRQEEETNPSQEPVREPAVDESRVHNGEMHVQPLLSANLVVQAMAMPQRRGLRADVFEQARFHAAYANANRRPIGPYWQKRV